MARKKPPPSNPGAVPAWFMTYSDVITLLMTFFILLLTFASNEPEKFERMQITMFGGGGSQGFASKSQDAMDRESIVTRFRPRASRLTQRGSETPSEMDEPQTGSTEDGLRALQEGNDLAQLQRLSVDVAIVEWADDQGNLTGIGQYQLQNIVRQMAAMPLELTLAVPAEPEMSFALKTALLLTMQGQVGMGRVSVALRPDVPSGKMRLILVRETVNAARLTQPVQTP